MSNSVISCVCCDFALGDLHHFWFVGLNKQLQEDHVRFVTSMFIRVIFGGSPSIKCLFFPQSSVVLAIKFHLKSSSIQIWQKLASKLQEKDLWAEPIPNIRKQIAND